MIGVVLWSDPAAGKAVFWCEDQADLAYFDASDPVSSVTSDDALTLGVGDMVQFDVCLDRQLRRAKSPKMIEQSACASLVDDLRKSGLGDVSCTSADVVRFKDPVAETIPICADHKTRKQG